MIALRRRKTFTQRNKTVTDKIKIRYPVEERDFVFHKINAHSGGVYYVTRKISHIYGGPYYCIRKINDKDVELIHMPIAKII